MGSIEQQIRKQQRSVGSDRRRYSQASGWWPRPEQLEPRLCLDGMPQFIGDMNTQPADATAGQYLPADDFVYFTARDALHGQELWRSDGTVKGTFLIKDVNPGPSDSRIQLTSYYGRGNVNGPNSVLPDNVLVFAADDGTHGRELWRSDGTAEGTFMLRDINAAGDSSPNWMQTIGDDVFFAATSDSTTHELWKTDGSVGGTVRIKSGFQSSNYYYGQSLSQFGEFDGQLVFVGEDLEHGSELWLSDGTKEGTSLVRDINPQGDGVARFACGHWRCTTPPTIHPELERVFFDGNDGQQRGFWVSDGTPDGTYALTEGTSNYYGNPNTRAITPNHLFFIRQQDSVTELWKSDGTREGTDLVRSFLDSWAQWLYTVGEDVYVSVYQNTQNRNELWRTDGSLEGTQQIDLVPDGANIQQMAAIGDSFFYYTQGNDLHQMWKVGDDGVPTQVDISTGQDSYLQWSEAVGDRLVFSPHHQQIWATDESGQEASIVFEGDDLRGYQRATWQGQLFFTGAGGQVWTTDGTSAGTQQISETPAATESSRPRHLVQLAGKTYFLNHGPESGLYVHEPGGETSRLVAWSENQWADLRSLTALGDRLVFNRNGNMYASDGISEKAESLGQAYQFAVAGDKLFMTDGRGLRMSDGTRSGTTRLGSFNSVGQIVAVNDRLFFLVHDNQNELWQTDGTEDGTTRVHRFDNNQWVSELKAAADRPFLYVYSGNGKDLWTSDGTEAGTILLKKLNNDGYYDSFDRDFYTLGNVAVFAADDGEHGVELWRSDGTEEGTQLVFDLDSQELTVGSNPANFTRVGDTVYFTAQNPPEQGRPNARLRSIWRARDNEPGLQRLEGEFNSIRELTAFGDRLLVNATEDSRGQGLWAFDGNGDKGVNLRTDQITGVTVVGDKAYFASGQGELWKTDGTRAGTSRVGTSSQTGRDPAGFFAMGDTLYYAATHENHGRELWKTLGTAGSTALVADINPGPAGSDPAELLALGEALLFSAHTEAHGRELWVSDAEGTRLVNDLRGLPTEDSLAAEFVQVGAWTYFVADDGVHGRELWRTNGEADGTELVHDSVAGPADRGPHNLYAVSEHLFYVATANDGQDVLWHHDSQTGEVGEVDSGSARRKLVSPREFTELNGQLFVSVQVACCDRALYVVNIDDERKAGATRLSSRTSPTELTAVGDQLFFSAETSEQGRELWKTDGTEAGTVLVQDIYNDLATATDASQFLPIGDQVYFTARDGTHGEELWVSDGTAEGTKLVSDILKGTQGSSPAHFTEFNGQLVFSAEGRSDKFGRELWLSDGTSAGTRTIKADNAFQYPQNPSAITQIGNGLFFFAEVQNAGVELWKSDGSSRGTQLVSRFYTSNRSAIRRDEQLVTVGDAVYFVANDGTHGRELWKSDGTNRGTTLVADLRPGGLGSISADVARHKLVAHDSKLFFAADSDGRLGAEIWVTDGSAGGTISLHDPRESGNGPLPLDVADDWLYFSSPDVDVGNELWKSDGTVANTQLVANLSPGSGSSIFFPHGEMTALDSGRFLFPAITTTAGRELWVSDGTESGTYALDLEPGTASTDFGRLVQVRARDGNAYFMASVPSRGTGLWQTDGTLAGTQLIVEGSLDPWPDLTLFNSTLLFGLEGADGGLGIYEDQELEIVPLKSPGSKGSSLPNNFAAVNDQLFFVADDGAHGREIWHSDGTADGTKMLIDTQPGFHSILPRELTLVGQQVFFSASDADTGRELWVMSATGEGHRLVKDISAGASSSTPSDLLAWNETVVFSVDDPVEGPTLWISDGTEAGTTTLASQVSSEEFGRADQPVVHQGALYVLADSGTADSRLWKFESVGQPPVLVMPSSVESIHGAGDNLVLLAHDPDAGMEPWFSDGTESGTRMLADINASTDGSHPRSAGVVHDRAYFLADRGSGRELLETDGSQAGTRSVDSFIPDLEGGVAQELLLADSVLYLRQTKADKTELWRVDPAGAEAKQLWADSDDRTLVDVLSTTSERVFLLARHPDTGTELWIWDGSAEGTRLLRDIHVGSRSSAISQWHEFRDGYIFVASDVERGDELWFTNGTTEGTYRVADIDPGSEGSRIQSMVAMGDVVRFAADDGVHGLEPWISDGTAEGTRMLANLRTGTVSSNPNWLATTDEDLFFVADDGSGRALWRWNMELEAPQRIDVPVSNPRQLSATDSALYFSGYDAEHGHELWLTDGTTEGTNLVTDLVPGEASSAPEMIQVLEDGSVYFTAVDSAHGRELWWLPSYVGDLDGDCVIDFADFLLFADRFGEPGTPEQGDFDHSGTIDFVDFLIFAANFGRPL